MQLRDMNVCWSYMYGIFDVNVLKIAEQLGYDFSYIDCDITNQQHYKAVAYENIVSAEWLFENYPVDSSVLENSVLQMADIDCSTVDCLLNHINGRSLFSDGTCATTRFVKVDQSVLNRQFLTKLRQLDLNVTALVHGYNIRLDDSKLALDILSNCQSDLQLIRLLRFEGSNGEDLTSLNITDINAAIIETFLTNDALQEPYNPILLLIELDLLDLSSYHVTTSFLESLLTNGDSYQLLHLLLAKPSVDFTRVDTQKLNRSRNRSHSFNRDNVKLYKLDPVNGYKLRY